MEALTQTVQALLQRQQNMEAEMAWLQGQNEVLRTAGLEQLPRLVATLQEAHAEGRAGDHRRRTLVDTRGLGRPDKFQAKEGEWAQWSRKFMNYVAACHERADIALEWATDQRESLSVETVAEQFGVDGEEPIADYEVIDAEVYMLLLHCMSEESFDIVSNVPRGRGLEAFRLLARRWDPTTGGRRKNLLRAVLQPGRSSLEDLSASLERWEDLVRRYERSRDSNGMLSMLSDDIKQAALEALVPAELEKTPTVICWAPADVCEHARGSEALCRNTAWPQGEGAANHWRPTAQWQRRLRPYGRRRVHEGRQEGQAGRQGRQRRQGQDWQGRWQARWPGRPKRLSTSAARSVV